MTEQSCGMWFFGIPLDGPDHSRMATVIDHLTHKGLYDLVGMTVDQRWMVWPWGTSRCISVSGYLVDPVQPPK